MLCMCEKKLIEMQEKKESPFDRIRKADNRTNKTKGDNLSSSENSLAHTRWNCKYHVVFIPKYQHKNNIWEITRRNRKNTETIV